MNKFKLYLTGGSPLETDRTLVMGILNATPDSFSDGGELSDKNSAERRIRQIIKDGADILDIGGESTRPGHVKVSEAKELERVLPIVKAVRKISKDIPISIDTQKSGVARAALEAGASFINDISALSDKKMAGVAADFKCSIILMRNKPTGPNVVMECRRQFEEIISRAEAQDIPKQRLLLDPGLGFGDLKSGDYKALPGSDYKANMLLVLEVQKYSLGIPIVIGGSRKRFVSEFSGEDDAKERTAGSVAIAVMAKQAGAAIVRVHDVADTVSAFSRIPSN